LEAHRAQRGLEPPEVPRPGVAAGSPQREMRAERATLAGEPQGPELPLHAVLQELERGVRRDADPHHSRPTEVGEHAEAAEREWQGLAAGDRALERIPQLSLAGVVHFAEKLERQVQTLGPDPLDREIA